MVPNRFHVAITNPKEIQLTLRTMKSDDNFLQNRSLASCSGKQVNSEFPAPAFVSPRPALGLS